MYWNISLAQSLKTLLFGSGFLAALGVIVAVFCYFLWNTDFSIPRKLQHLGKWLCFTLCFIAVAYPCRLTYQLLALPVLTLAESKLCSSSQLDEAQSIIVLGGGTHYDGILSIGSQRRVHAAIDLVRENSTNHTLVFTGGRVNKSKPYEAMVMGSYYQKLAAPRQTQVVLEELRSLQTRQHPIFIKEIFKDLGKELKTPVIVTNDFHMLRSILTFQKQDIKACGYPAGSALANPEPQWFSFSHAKMTKRLLNEYLGLFGYWAKGWI